LTNVPRVVFVTNVGCHPCQRVKRILAALRPDFPALDVEEVDFTSPQGLELAVRHNILYPPALLIDGKLFAYGKIFEEPLREALGRAEA